jgi:hypothetical protein
LTSPEVRKVVGHVLKGAGVLLVIALLVVGLARGVRQDAESQRDRERLHDEMGELRRLLDEERRQRMESEAAYMNRAVIQKALKDRAVERGWYTPDEVKKLHAAEVGAKYPGEAFAR